MIQRLNTRALQPGMVTIEPICTPSGQLLTEAGTTLTKQIINKMKLYRVVYAIVETSDTPTITPEPVADTDSSKATTEAPASSTLPQKNRSHTQKIVASTEFVDFKVNYYNAIEYLKDVFAKTISQKGYAIDTEELIASIAPLYMSRKTITETFDMIQQMHTIEDSVYAHCLNVALIARMIGRWLHMEQHDLNVLTCCGLLHDIGKLTIPDTVLNKPEKLTDEEFALVRSHAKASYDLLRNQNIDNRIKQAALMHHERYDGSGYPHGLSSEFLSDESMIIAIADVYDAMTAARSYRAQLCPFEVIANFEREGFQKYHTKYIYIFLNRIATTYQNNRVMLNDGRACKIVMLNQNLLSKPVVQLDDGSCIDLSTEKELYITKIL